MAAGLLPCARIFRTRLQRHHDNYHDNDDERANKDRNKKVY
jgi:hypothetical protein